MDFEPSAGRKKRFVEKVRRREVAGDLNESDHHHSQIMLTGVGVPTPVPPMDTRRK
jgi:hypothetical protein